MTCQQCGNRYGRRDDMKMGKRWREHGWRAVWGLCYVCWLEKSWEIFGDAMLPILTLGGIRYCEHGVVPEPVDNELPF